MERKRGIVKIDFGDGVERSLRFTLGAIARLEERFEKPMQEIFSKEEDGEGLMKRLGMKGLIFLIWTGLRGGGDTEITEDALGDMMDMRDMEMIVSKFAEAMDLASSGGKPVLKHVKELEKQDPPGPEGASITTS